MPGPKSYPLIGSTYYFFRHNSKDFLDIVIKLTRDYLSPCKFCLGNKLVIVIYEADQIQAILQNSVDKSVAYKLMEPIFGKGILTAPVSIWIKNRKIITPSINTNMLRKLFDIFVQQSLILTDELETVGLNGNKTTLLEHILKCNLNAACGTLTNMKMNNFSNEINHLIQVIISDKKIFKLRLRNVLLYPNFIFNLTVMGRKHRKNMNFLNSFTDKLIQISALNEENIKKKYEPTKKTLIDILIEVFHEDKFPQKIIRDNLKTMILTASDTTSVTIDFAIFMLANFPEIQEKVYEELLEIYGTVTPKSARIKYEDLQHMNYLDRFIKETMRLFPTVPLIGRHLTEDVKMGEFILPKGVEIAMPIFSLHRNEKYWHNPLIFDPDRFLPEKIGTSYNNYYMPFGLGPRNCIGMKYAMISMKVTLATLIRTFIFKVDKRIQIDEIKLNMDITLSSVEPIEVKIEKRELR
ncbi:cytochrome P450 4C1-like isoform X2 [Camponotus floridanus]|uniref:cytochrome P450 4C1-like isoform X2 n=1 Tax=Camponotus floridanus TaxID=104421 RepID=UPI000DC692D8|nr:cytochrome P450 4C1-like isoform X2 [Camponotus floridanus]